VCAKFDSARADDRHLHTLSFVPLFYRSGVIEELAMADNGLNVVRVCARGDVPPGTVRAFAVESNTLAVYNIDGAYYVTDDKCTHAVASLADGMLDGDVIECCMGSFHVPTGKCSRAALPSTLANACGLPQCTFYSPLSGRSGHEPAGKTGRTGRK
jgi:nitrite reductase/ring-hydroxylating ferredoxin subunit